MNVNTRQIPTRVQALIDTATRQGLTVADTTEAGITTVGQFEISSTHPAEARRIWINTSYNTDGKPGATTIGLYDLDHPVHNQHGTFYTRKLTQANAIAAILSLTPPPATPARVIAEDDMQTVVRAIKADPAPTGRTIDQVDDMRAAAQAAKLDRNGRVSLRLVRNTGPIRNHLVPATPGKIRAAFIRRGLTDNTGRLTDLGHAVRNLVVSA